MRQGTYLFIGLINATEKRRVRILLNQFKQRPQSIIIFTLIMSLCLNSNIVVAEMSKENTIQKVPGGR